MGPLRPVTRGGRILPEIFSSLWKNVLDTFFGPLSENPSLP